MKQKTIKKEVRFSGKALQSGLSCAVICAPAAEGVGIVFRNSDVSSGKTELKLGDDVFLGGSPRRTTIGTDAFRVQTVEHFLAALWALEIDNLFVTLDSEELPAMDGSALVFLTELKKAGIVEQKMARSFIRIEEPESVEENGKKLSIFPDDKFSVSYLIDYPVPSIGRKTLYVELDGKMFEEKIAPARTFCLKSEAEALIKAGLGKGANTENTLVMGDTGPLETVLRFPDEPVRHKVLDLVGDLYTLGRPILGRVEAEKSGHSLNAKMVRLIYDKYVK